MSGEAAGDKGSKHRIKKHTHTGVNLVFLGVLLSIIVGGSGGEEPENTKRYTSLVGKEKSIKEGGECQQSKVNKVAGREHGVGGGGSYQGGFCCQCFGTITTW